MPTGSPPFELLRHKPWLLPALFAGILLPLLLCGKIAGDLRGFGALRGDIAGLYAVHRFANPRLDSWVVLATRLGALLAIPALAGVALGLRKLWRAESATFFILSLGGAAGLNLAAKLFFERARPALWDSPNPEYDFSFPSGHAMMSMAAAAALIAIAWPTRLRWPALILGSAAVLLIGLSRLYLEVHYPSDVLAGWAAGLAWVLGLRWGLRAPLLDDSPVC